MLCFTYRLQHWNVPSTIISIIASSSSSFFEKTVEWWLLTRNVSASPKACLPSYLFILQNWTHSVNRGLCRSFVEVRKGLYFLQFSDVLFMIVFFLFLTVSKEEHFWSLLLKGIRTRENRWQSTIAYLTHHSSVPSDTFIKTFEEMLLPFAFILILIATLSKTQIDFYSDIDLSRPGSQFQPANTVELLSTVLISSIADCAQGKNWWYLRNRPFSSRLSHGKTS